MADELDSEQEKVAQQAEDRAARRYREARDAGWSRADAHTFSLSELDIGKLRELAAAGCPAPTAARILL